MVSRWPSMSVLPGWPGTAPSAYQPTTLPLDGSAICVPAVLIRSASSAEASASQTGSTPAWRPMSSIVSISGTPTRITIGEVARMFGTTWAATVWGEADVRIPHSTEAALLPTLSACLRLRRNVLPQTVEMPAEPHPPPAADSLLFYATRDRHGSMNKYRRASVLPSAMRRFTHLNSCPLRSG